DQKAVGTANSSGALLPWDRFGQLWLTILAVIGTSLAAATVYTPQLVRTVLGWFWPIGQLIQWLFTAITFALFWLLNPFLEWLARVMQEAMAEQEALQQAQGIPTPQPLTLTQAVQEFSL